MDHGDNLESREKIDPKVPSSSSSALSRSNKKLIFRENIKLENMSYQTNLSMALRKQVHDLKEELRVKNKDLAAMKRDIRSTRLFESEAENNVLVNECIRLRAYVEQLYSQMPAKDLGRSSPDVRSSPLRENKSKEDLIENLLRANEQFHKAEQEKDHKIMELQSQLIDMEAKLGK